MHNGPGVVVSEFVVEVLEALDDASLVLIVPYEALVHAPVILLDRPYILVILVLLCRRSHG